MKEFSVEERKIREAEGKKECYWCHQYKLLSEFKYGNTCNECFKKFRI